MRTIIILISFCFIASLAGAQKMKDADVPQAIKESLNKLYPVVEELEWQKEEANIEAEFEVDETITSLLFDASGNVLETEVEILPANLPVLAKEYLTKNFPGKKTKETSKMIDAEGVTYFEAEIDKIDYIFDENGNFFKTIDESGKKDKD
jgi:hypothetical protein